MKIVYKELPPIFGGIKDARYKGVIATIAEGDDWISIYSIESSNKRKNEVNEFINLLKQDYPDKELWSSIPLNNVWGYIAHKYGIKHLESGDERSRP